MSFVAGLLTAVLVLDSLFLILLILVQLPKKEAGVGQAFGGGATDALFGAGTGNALTNMTKYAAGIFLTLCLVLYIMGGQARKAGSGVRDALKKEQTGSVLPPKAPAPTTLTAPPVALPPKSILNTAPVATNAPAAKTAPASAPTLLTATNAAAPKASAPVTTPPSTTPPAKK
ncbi:MAG: preprotein translocase subunit SecG [Pedosphaera sp.]|nr:preprotein translocase subunit SecG [Pedosphaera sp.]